MSRPGVDNPNYRGVMHMTKPCEACGKPFYPGYAHKTRRFCSRACMFTSPSVMERVKAHLKKAATVPRKPRIRLGRQLQSHSCTVCGGTYTAYRKKQACSPACHREMFARKPRRSPKYECSHCGTFFHSSPSCLRKFCSYPCFIASGGSVRAGLASAKMTRKYGAKKDANHNEICDALKKGGCAVIDISKLGCGLPDIIVCRQKKIYLVEIKNRATGYGRKGANKNQKAWADGWPEKVYILNNIDDVERFLAGDIDAIQSYGGLARTQMAEAMK